MPGHPKITDIELSTLAAVGEAAAQDVREYTTPRGTLTTWDSRRVGRMLARDPFVADLIPKVLAYVAELRGNLARPRRRPREVLGRQALATIARISSWISSTSARQAELELQRWADDGGRL